MLESQKDIKSHIKEVEFSYYNPEEIRKISIKEIKNEKAFDVYGNLLSDGLYDPAMGVSPYDPYSKCVTCGLDYIECPGHMGHIELIVPVYNVNNMKDLGKLLKCICFNCQSFKCTEAQRQYYKTQFKLLKLGLDTEYIQYQKCCKSKIDESASHTSRKPSSTSQTTKSDDESAFGESEEIKVNKKNNDMIEEIGKIEKLLKNIHPMKKKFKKGIVATSFSQEQLKEIVKDFWVVLSKLKTCSKCHKVQPTVNKEGYEKFVFSSSKKAQGKIGKVLKNQKKASKEEKKDAGNKKIDNEKKEDDEKIAVENSKNKKETIISPTEVKEILRLVWENEISLLRAIFGIPKLNFKLKKGYEFQLYSYSVFFIDALPVPPNRFRPENKVSDQAYLHHHTVSLKNILVLNSKIAKTLGQCKKKSISDIKQEKDEKPEKEPLLDQIYQAWLEMQNEVNTLFDSSKHSKATSSKAESGIKQLLEKKEGIFRMKMMGKRVNYAARSVISPDPNLSTCEVGVPIFMAKKLTFPEFVNEHNAKKLQEYIVKGASGYPGANCVEEGEKKYFLEGMNLEERKNLASRLLHDMQKKKVHRHMITGDAVLFNRQPTLHKPSLMSHIVKVLPREQTIRMHYANCGGYNADFDGDEMNLHFLQNHLARSEAYHLSQADLNYIVSTSGNPIRGLIQDSVLSACFLTLRSVFLNKSEYQQLVYCSLWKFLDAPRIQKIKFLQPAIIKPVMLWTGKQVISTIIQTLADELKLGNGMNIDSNCKIPEKYLKPCGIEDATVIIRDNELLCGIIDKNQIGPSGFGMVHCFYELYGPVLAGKLITALTKLLVIYLQYNGFTCGMDDLMLTNEAEKLRAESIESMFQQGTQAISKFVGLKNYRLPEKLRLFRRPLNEKPISKKIKDILKEQPDVEYFSPQNELIVGLEKKIVTEKDGSRSLDTFIKGTLAGISKKINEECFSNGLIKKFPFNNFHAMVLSGAKGSVLNHTQVSCMLGQQELEGRRVPLMPSGRTLPSFMKYDPNPRASGFIADRFLTGLRPQEFFFHCMAGREGLIDTAVKTSRSGYLQRCLMKNLESLVLEYDYTVRVDDGSIIQFFYGEDSLDPVKVKALSNFNYLRLNEKAFEVRYDKINLKKNKKLIEFLNSRQKNPEKYKNKTLMQEFPPWKNLGSMSEKCLKNLKDFMAKQKMPWNDFAFKKNEFPYLYALRYFLSLASPGDSVGAIAAQSFGEPSTQMTLNTFHLAGHGGANVTLGIPRLREILCTKKTGTPMMTLLFNDLNIKKYQARQYARKLERLMMISLVQKVEIQEKNKILDDNKTILSYVQRGRSYKILIYFEDMNIIKECFGEIKEKFLKKKMKNEFLHALNKIINQYVESGKNKKKEDFVLNDTKNLIADDKALRKASMTDTEDHDISIIKEPEQDDEADIEEEHEKDEEENNENSNPDDTLWQSIKTLEKNQKESEENKVVHDKKEKLDREFSWKNGICKVVVQVPLDAEKILMMDIVEKILKRMEINHVDHIGKCHVLKKKIKLPNGEEKQVNYIQTEGVNFPHCWRMPFLNTNKIESNDIYSILKYYGIEATRSAIIKEIKGVFEMYGITVDFRHMSLVSDYMTFPGFVIPLTRVGIDYSVSPFLKMSFETTTKFLSEACFYQHTDYVKTPSSQLVLGQPIQNGTGKFQILHNFEAEFSDKQFYLKLKKKKHVNILFLLLIIYFCFKS